MRANGGGPEERTDSSPLCRLSVYIGALQKRRRGKMEYKAGIKGLSCTLVKTPKAKCSAVFSLTSNQLKLLAVLAMAFDHCMVLFADHSLALYALLRMPGRVTAPVMCFLIAQGYRHTSNLKRYIGRLGLMAMVSHIPFCLCFGYDPLAFGTATDVMWALMLGLIALTICRSQGQCFGRKLLMTAFCCGMAYSAD